jgi:hypothetical protein
MRALERDVDRRYQTADELRDALETYLVEERILVPAAGVKGLLRRVLGGKIDQRRQQIRSALRALDGAQEAHTLVSEESLVADEPVSVSVSANANQDDVPSDPSFSGSAVSSSTSASLGAAFLPGDGSSGVQTLSQPSGPPVRPGQYLLVGGALGIALAALVVALLSMRPAEPEVRQGLGTPASASASAPAKRWPAAGPEAPRGLSLDSLPEAHPTAAGAPVPPHALTHAAPASGPVNPQLAADMAALRAAPQVNAEKLTLEDDDKNRLRAIANSVSLDDTTPKAPKVSEASVASGEFDRRAAQAALGQGASLVGMCRRPGGAKGSSRALVTFGPSGRVDSVRIEGAIAGSPVADCAAQKFKNGKVPAFSGAPVTVSKSFVIPD